MAKWIVGHGIDDYVAKLGNLEDSSEETCKRAVYDGAAIVADAVKASIAALPVGSPREGKVTEAQKAGLLSGMGIASFRNEGGFINVKVGMDGYNSQTSRKYPKGQPNAMIARSLESGTSFSPKRAFIGPAVSKSRAAAEAAIKATLEKEIGEKMGG